MFRIRTAISGYRDINSSDICVKVKASSPLYKIAKLSHEGDTLDIRGTISHDKTVVPIRYENLRICHPRKNAIFNTINRAEIRGPISSIFNLDERFVLRVYTEEIVNGKKYYSNIDIVISSKLQESYYNNAILSRIGDIVDVRGVILSDTSLYPTYFENFFLCTANDCTVGL